jgi:hypothetical protein
MKPGDIVRFTSGSPEVLYVVLKGPYEHSELSAFRVTEVSVVYDIYSAGGGVFAAVKRELLEIVKRC